ncbi:MAG: Maltose acetyltransferase [Thelocarpon impressellum]|nr:MAG: Maltose acetyltransferase [Thelocarpon impressellum]
MSAASVSQYSANGVGHLEKDHMGESPPSRFTAVNGRDSSASAATLNGDGDRASRPGSTDRPTMVHPRDVSPKRRQREDVVRLAAQRERAQQDESRADATQAGRPSSSNHAARSDAYPGSTSRPGTHKRKRSGSAERPSSSSGSYDSRGPPRSPPREHGRETEHHRRARSSSESPRRDAYDPARSDRSARRDEGSRDDARAEGQRYGHGSRGSWGSYDEQRADSPGSRSDARLAEALRRDSLNVESIADSRMAGSPDDDDRGSHDPRGAEYGTDRTPTSGVQVDHRRRKRVFSNRTKTGCMTCRRRKKKCDEQKPECKSPAPLPSTRPLADRRRRAGNNCIRGGFVCEGYSNRIEWQKSSREKAPVPLQAKDGEATPGPYPPSARHGGTPQDDRGHSHGRDLSPGGYRAPHASHGPAGGVARPILVDEERERTGHRAVSPNKPPSSDTRSADWSKPTWSNPGPPSYLSEHLPKADYSRVPPLRELSRGVDVTDSSAPHSGASHRSIVHSGSTHSNSPQHTPQQAQAQAQAQAQMALQHNPSLRSRRPSRSEKEKMLAGELYFPNAPELVYERDRCKAAIWRFNNSMNPTLGISKEERSRLFRDVVQPRDPPASSSAAAPQSPTGRVGENVVVEAPFICDYGYNITIGADVLIDTNCTVKDTCSVVIGARTVIGPDVKLLTATMPIDPRRRKGSQGPSLGRSITIEEDCWIGAGAIIL